MPRLISSGLLILGDVSEQLSKTIKATLCAIPLIRLKQYQLVVKLDKHSIDIYAIKALLRVR
jgi:hypothetical protein